jgi:hypothetical protein
MSDQWLSIVEYARTYNVSDMTVRRRIRNGKLHAVLREGKYFIPIDEQATTTETSPAIMKGHPSARSTIRPPETVISVEQKTTAKPGLRATQNYRSPSSTPQVRPHQYHGIPSEIIEPISSEPVVSLATQNLLGFCETMIQRLDKSERNVRNEYDAKLKELRAINEAKNLEISHLNQQVEDLQLLVSIIDREK